MSACNVSVQRRGRAGFAELAGKASSSSSNTTDLRHAGFR
ncbi:hypothetical protein XOC_0631 [Xanthomonas oryzae pv. oryzicola BLS256]|uniref:Uncharacterized protein n=1 Tax=Xanthomonas oryzae pv. oryzicola (strain BLS256) TaxID=383407 RepID=G7TBG0_XANOB|nr:hypothetical protein XOC_0631 [Xanthomonas oryzae pv. oryzicola BLS256]